jgi:hypothetical protein
MRLRAAAAALRQLLHARAAPGAPNALDGALQHTWPLADAAARCQGFATKAGRPRAAAAALQEQQEQAAQPAAAPQAAARQQQAAPAAEPGADKAARMDPAKVRRRRLLRRLLRRCRAQRGRPASGRSRRDAGGRPMRMSRRLCRRAPRPRAAALPQAEQLQAVMQMINKKFGKGSIQRLGSSSAPPNL